MASLDHSPSPDTVEAGYHDLVYPIYLRHHDLGVVANHESGGTDIIS